MNFMFLIKCFRQLFESYPFLLTLRLRQTNLLNQSLGLKMSSVILCEQTCEDYI